MPNSGKYRVEVQTDSIEPHGGRTQWKPLTTTPFESAEAAQAHIDTVVKTSPLAQQSTFRPEFRVAPITLEELGLQRIYLWNSWRLDELPGEKEDEEGRIHVDLPVGDKALMDLIRHIGKPVVIFPPDKDEPYFRITGYLAKPS